MSSRTSPLPVDVVIAVLHRVRDKVRIRDDVRLAQLFNDAAKKHPTVFGMFVWHPKYHDCPILAETLHILDMGGGIERFNAATRWYQATEVTLGSEGQNVYSTFGDAEKAAVDELAEQIKRAFGSESTK